MRRALRERIEAPGFTITLQDADSAAEERLEEGRFLIASGYLTAGIYVLGYVAEILLKTAYVRVAHPGARPAYNLGSALREARVVGDVLLPAIDTDGFHSIRFWAMLIQAVRLGQGREMNGALRLRKRLMFEWQRSIALTVSLSDAVISLPESILIEDKGNEGPLGRNSTHLYVIWEEWESFTPSERSEIIMDAYQATHMISDVVRVTIAKGLTPVEAKKMGLVYRTERQETPSTTAPK